MSIITQHKVHCPYCNKIKYIAIESDDLQKVATFHCKGSTVSNPGCDRVFAVQLVLLPRVQIFELVPTDNGKPIEDLAYDRRLDIEAEAVQ